MGLHEDTVDTYDDAVSFFYLASILGSLGFFIGIRYYLKHKTCLNKKYDVWKILDKFSSNRAVLVTSFFAVLTAVTGGLLNSADEGIFLRAVLYAIPAGILCAILTGSPILFVTGAIFTYTGILQSPVCPESMILAKDCLNNTNAFGSFDWFLGTPSPTWTEESRWSHDMIDLTLRGLMWTIPLGLTIRSYRYSSLISFSGLAMGLAYHAGSSYAAPFPLCLMGLSPGTSLGDFYMGAYMFFIITVCLLGSNHPMSATRGGETCQESPTSPAPVIKPAPTVVVDVRGFESEKQFLKTRALDTDTETDEEPLAVATVIGHPVSSPLPQTPPSTSTPNANAHKLRRCGRPVHGSRAMQCCWAAHFFLSLFLISVTVFMVCIWWDYSPEGLEKINSSTDNDDGLFFGWDSWYMWLFVFFLITFSYRRRHGRRYCCRRPSGQ